MARNNNVSRHSLVEHRFCCQSFRFLIAQCSVNNLNFTQSFRRKLSVRNSVDQTTIAFALLNLVVQIAIVAAILRLSQQPPVIYCRRKKQLTLAAGLDVGQETGHQLVVVSAIVSLLSDRRYGSIFTYRGKIAVRFSTPPEHGWAWGIYCSRRL